MELNMAYVVSERPAVGRSGPMVDPEGLSRCPSLFPDWPCTRLVPNREFYPEVEIPCPGADFLLVSGRLPRQNGLLELQYKVVPSQSSIARVLPGLHSKGWSNGNYGGENGGVKVRLTWS